MSLRTFFCGLFFLRYMIVPYTTYALLVVYGSAWQNAFQRKTWQRVSKLGYFRGTSRASTIFTTHPDGTATDIISDACIDSWHAVFHTKVYVHEPNYSFGTSLFFKFHSITSMCARNDFPIFASTQQP